MIDARAKLLNEEPKGARAFVADPFPPSSSQAPLSAPYSSTRSTVETLEYSQPVSSVQAETRGKAAAEDEEQQPTEWCVDFGPVLATMDTFELWAAIDRGDITPAMRVWREGMECWTPIEKLPELAVALTTASSRTPEPVTLHMPPKAPALSAAVPAPASTAVPDPLPTPTEEVRPPASTLISGPQTSSWTRISHRILPPPERRRAGAQFWVALGSAVAATAVTAALAGGSPRRAPIAPDVRVGVTVPAPVPAAAPEPMVTGSAAVSAAPVDLPLPALSATVDEDAAAGEGAAGGGAGEVRPRHDDRGQHRLRRSGRPSSGR